MAKNNAKPRQNNSRIDGYLKASADTSGLLSLDYEKVLNDFRAFTSVEARAAFADRWVRLTAKRMEQAWPILYELWKTIEDQHLYADPAHLEDKKPYESFKAYWTGVMGRPFDEWQRLENIHKYAHRFKPELFGLPLSVAQQKMQESCDMLDGKIINAGPGPLTKDEKYNGDIITINSTEKGTSAAYLTARIARDRPDILARMKAGDYKSVRAAAKDAGIVKDKTPLQHVQTGWRHATLEDKRLIVTWIQDRLQDDPELLDNLGS